MIDNYRTARIIRIILVLIIIVIAIVGLVVAAQYLFFSGSTVDKKSDASASALLSTSVGSSVRMTVRGEIVADEEFRSYQIDITPDRRMFRAYSGYLENQIDSVDLENNMPAYEQFVHALYRADYSVGIETNNQPSDLLGICSSGKLYEFYIIKDGRTVKKLWTTSCSNTKGSLRASFTQINRLFINQIPKVQTNIGKVWR